MKLALWPNSFISELDDAPLQFTTYDEIPGAEPGSEELGTFFGSCKAMLSKLQRHSEHRARHWTPASGGRITRAPAASAVRLRGCR